MCAAYRNDRDAIAYTMLKPTLSWVCMRAAACSCDAIRVSTKLPKDTVGVVFQIVGCGPIVRLGGFSH